MFIKLKLGISHRVEEQLLLAHELERTHIDDNIAVTIFLLQEKRIRRPYDIGLGPVVRKQI